MLSNICNKILIEKTYSERAHKALWNHCGIMFGDRKKIGHSHLWSLACCEWTSKDDVENYKEDIVVKMEEWGKQWEEKNKLKTVHFMNDNYKKSIEVHIELRLNFDEQ